MEAPLRKPLQPPFPIRIDAFRWPDGTAGWDVLRLDLLHPVVSGNKPFKLSPYLQRARQEGLGGIVTFGGPYSNHIHATAHAAAAAGIPSIGIIRGEEPARPSPTLRDAAAWGMQLRFLSRECYRTLHQVKDAEAVGCPPGWMVIPEGGQGPEGVQGARSILDGVSHSDYDRIVCACGTGTTAAGLRLAAGHRTAVVGISVLKGHHGLTQAIRVHADKAPLQVVDGYHFGGYARTTPALLAFMRRFRSVSGIPTDFVYTAKLMYAIDDLFRTGTFAPEERVLAIHSGGLQGNRSLPDDILADT